ncbi:hypothetical protein ACRRTK_024284 [Alexandromys fortis]
MSVDGCRVEVYRRPTCAWEVSLQPPALCAEFRSHILILSQIYFLVLSKGNSIWCGPAHPSQARPYSFLAVF